jgi:hypothetical protein
MTDEMRAAARPANDRFQYFGLVRNGRIAGGARSASMRRRAALGFGRL